MISIVLPVYNEITRLDDGLAALTGFFNDLKTDHELIVVDDGSALGPQIKLIAAHHNCLYIRNEQNAGKGVAVKRGVLAAKGDHILFMDGDFPFHLSIVQAIIDELQREVVAIGDRTLPGSRFPDTLSRSRKWGSRILSWIISNFYVKGIRDSQCGIKGFRAHTAKSVFDKVTFSRFAFDVEVLFIARKNNYHIARLPVHVYPQATTSVKVLKDGFSMLWGLARITINDLTGKYRIDE
ncbi:glycosyltransferase [Paraflavitalea sp. CAU 1676]|uniref:glycosyltransferase n=1 Tax=Paraflavitalea sp. CAU 1676 TaxID=3032598 RepID=UPI0023DA0AAD|nr:glycosyltransferase [Paraflavitalea sp. CAU 1676]MDF2189782.1 glycosyltransferase [Paraflavitalea sp. CAU 1676]